MATQSVSFGVPALMYHEIADPTESTSRLAVTPRSFAEQLGLLHDKGFHAVTGFQLSRALAGDEVLPPRPIVLTFDDGYSDFHSVALPLLQRYGYVATVFVTAGWVENNRPALSRPPPGRMLSWSQVADLVCAGIEVGAHTRSHPQLDRLPRDRVRHELAASKDELEERLGRSVPGLAYPFGYSNDQVRQQASEVGYGYAFAVGDAMVTAGSHAMALPRLTVRRSLRPSAFEQIVEGDKLQRTFVVHRTATRGWAVVRRARAVVGGAARVE